MRLLAPDDAADVVQEVATEEFQRFGGSEALGAPYLEGGFFEMMRKRAGWISALFLGEMLTATAMGHFEAEIQRAVVLALFVPLIISVEQGQRPLLTKLRFLRRKRKTDI